MGIYLLFLSKKNIFGCICSCSHILKELLSTLALKPIFILIPEPQRICYDSLNTNFFFFNVFLSSFCRRQKDAEQKSIEEEANKRIEDLVAKRVEEELERRRDEIEAEVLRRVEEAKKIMEAQMLEELERRKQEQLEEAQRREVRNLLKSSRIRLKSISSSMSCIRRPTQSTKKSTYSQK